MKIHRMTIYQPLIKKIEQIEQISSVKNNRQSSQQFSLRKQKQDFHSILEEEMKKKRK